MMFENLENNFSGFSEISGVEKSSAPDLKKNNPKKSYTIAKLNRLTNDWVKVGQSINFDLYSGLSVMRARARDLYQNDPIAKKFIALLRKNVIGPDGFTLKVKAYDIIKTSSGSKQIFDKFANRLIQDKFWYWSKKENCTIQKNASFREINELILSTVAIDGECFIHKLKGPEYGEDFAFTLQVIDAGMIDEKLNKVLDGGRFIQMGIEYDRNRIPLRYYIRKQKPYEDISYGAYLSTDYDIIDAANMIHIYVKEFVNQSRGVSWFAPVAFRMHMINKTSEAAVTNFRIGASKTLLLKPTEQADPNMQEGDEVDPYGKVLDNVEPGVTYKIPYGYEPHDYSPQYPNTEFGVFTESIMQQIASGLDTTHPSLSSSYRGTTWTSSRTALIDERDGWKRIQNWYAEHFLNDVYSDWLKMALLTEILSPLPAAKFKKFNEPYFYGRGWAWVDPEKEENARIKALQYNFKTFAEIIAEENKDLEEHLEELAAEKELFKKYKIEFPKDVPATEKDDPEDAAATSSENNSNNNGKKNGVHSYG